MRVAFFLAAAILMGSIFGRTVYGEESIDSHSISRYTTWPESFCVRLIKSFSSSNFEGMDGDPFDQRRVEAVYRNFISSHAKRAPVLILHPACKARAFIFLTDQPGRLATDKNVSRLMKFFWKPNKNIEPGVSFPDFMTNWIANVAIGNFMHTEAASSSPADTHNRQRIARGYVSMSDPIRQSGTNADLHIATTLMRALVRVSFKTDPREASLFSRDASSKKAALTYMMNEERITPYDSRLIDHLYSD